MAAYYPISAYTDTTGMSIYITFESMLSGGTYNFGLGIYNNPDNAKIQVNLSSPGYTNGVAVTKSRSCVGVPCERPYATGAMRLAYPSQSVADEVVAGSNVIIRIALSEFIYSEDTYITVDVGTGFYTQGGNQSQPVTALPVVNNSTIDYSRVVGNWAIAKYDLVVGSTWFPEYIAFHRFSSDGRPVDCVDFNVTDGVNTVSVTVSNMSISPDSPNNPILVYRPPSGIDLSPLNSGICTAKIKAYPHIGNANCILDTDDGANAGVTPLYSNLTFRLDKAGVHGFVLVDPVSGSDTTGAVYSSQVLAESGSACKTIDSALTKLAAYHNTYAGHNDAGGGTILCKEATYTIATTNGLMSSTSAWCTIRPATGALKENVIVQGGTGGDSIPYRLKLDGVTFSGSGFFLGSDGTKSVYLKDCELNTTGSLSIASTPYSVCHNCTGTLANQFLGTSSDKLQWGLIRGNNMTTRHGSIGWTIIGNKNVAVQIHSNTGTEFNDNLVYAYNYNSVGTSQWVDLDSEIYQYTHGVAIVQNLFIRYGSTTEPHAGIGAADIDTNNILVHHNTFAGARTNFGYNDASSGGPYPKTNFSFKNNIFSNYNNKDDIFGTNPLGNGSWSVGYGIGFSGNFFRSAMTTEWLGEFTGIYSAHGSYETPLSPQYVNDQSADGGNTSGGDYHLQSSSPAIGLAHELVLPYDFEGNIRTVNNAAGVYRYSNLSIPIFKNYFQQIGVM